MRHLIYLGCFLFTCIQAMAADAPYHVKNIPEALQKKAHVVKRMEEVRFEFINTGESILKKKYALTILNENGDRFAVFSEGYDKLRSIRSIEGTLYDDKGNVIKKLKSKDIQDISGVSDNNLIDDNRIKHHHFYHRVYPYTVEYEVEIRYHATLFFPYWLPQEGEFFSVEKSRFSIVTPQNYTFRYKSFNYKGEPATTTEKGKRTSTWEVAQLPPIKKQYASPAWQELTTMVFSAPTLFEVENYKGNMSDWNEFGKFVYALKKDKDLLPENIKQEVNRLTSTLKEDKQKIKALYEYLQKNTRYISIQLGIGGWQPYDAAYVAKKGYGDCKALTNYMYSLLKSAGIPSYYALVSAGDDGSIIEDLPSQQFNHVILCVPLQKDTVWLECTSQTLPAGYVSDFTANRKSLLVSEKGGVLVNTPRYGLKENLQVRKIRGAIDEEGTLLSKVETRYLAMQQDNLHSLINNLSKEKVKEVLQEKLELSTYDVHAFRYTENKDFYPEIQEHLDLEVSRYATITGKRLFIGPNLLNKSHIKLSMEEERLYDICFTYPYKDIDTVLIELPKGYKIESLPQPVSLKTAFGTYTNQVRLQGNQLEYIRIREHFAGRYAAKEYTDMAKFYDAIYKADRSRVVLVKSE